MKKTSVILLSITIIISLLFSPFTPFLALGTSPTISAGSISAQPGEEIIIPIVISNNPGISGATITVTFSPKLTLTQVLNGDAFSTLQYTAPGSFTSPCNFTWDSENIETNDNGEILLFTFKVSEEAVSNEELPINVSYVFGDIYNRDLENVLFETINGTVTVVGGTHEHTGGLATCKDPAVCTVCGQSYGKTDPTNHTGNTEIRNQKDATCSEAGYTGDTYCKDCGALLSQGEEIKITAHDYEAVVTEPTCKEGGYTTYTCKFCGDTYTGDETDPVPHDYEAVVTDPTCTEDGYTTYTCKFCGDSYTGDETKSLGHDYKDEVTEPTCTEKGYTTHTCSRCGDSYTDTETEALGHDYTSVVTEPTCTEQGYTTYTCSRCGDTYKDDYTDTVPHTLEHVEGKEATCTEKGALEYWKCSVCNKLFSDENGETEITEKDIVIKALGHEWGAWTVTKAATLEKSGLETRTCSRCGEVQTRIIPSLGHRHAYHKIEAKEATCEENGNIEYYECVDCGLLFKKNGSGEFEEIEIEDTVTEALGHDFGEWITTVAPTETTEGEQTRTCSRNWQHVETRTVPKADHTHNLTHIAANESTCDKPGNKEYWVCAGCNKYFSDAAGNNEIKAEDVIVEALGHEWGEWTVTKEAQVGQKGEETRTCKHDASHTETREIPALPETENTDAQTEEPSTETPEVPEIVVPVNETIVTPETSDSKGTIVWISIAAVSILGLSAALFLRKMKIHK